MRTDVSRIRKIALGADGDVAGLPLRAAVGLMNHDFAVRQGEALALGSGRSSNAPKEAANPTQIVRTSGLTYCIVSRDGVSGRRGSAGAVDVHMDVLFRIFGGEKEQLGNDTVGRLIVDG